MTIEKVLTGHADISDDSYAKTYQALYEHFCAVPKIEDTAILGLV